MSYKDITPGTKVARPTKMRFIEAGDKKTPAIEVAFEFVEPSTGNTEALTWQGWITDKSRERTMDTLVEVLGYNGDQSVGEGGVFTHERVLNFEQEVSLVVELEEYNGKSYPKIKWVNALGGSAYGNVEAQVVENRLGALNFKALFLATRQKSGAPAPKAPVDPEKLPF